jgi:hypothetical protein
LTRLGTNVQTQAWSKIAARTMACGNAGLSLPCSDT